MFQSLISQFRRIRDDDGRQDKDFSEEVWRLQLAQDAVEKAAKAVAHAAEVLGDLIHSRNVPKPPTQH